MTVKNTALATRARHGTGERQQGGVTQRQAAQRSSAPAKITRSPALRPPAPRVTKLRL